MVTDGVTDSSELYDRTLELLVPEMSKGCSCLARPSVCFQTAIWLEDAAMMSS